MTVHLKDIAAYTGVSIKTVSNVVNGNYEHVGPETRALVLDAIKKMNYKPNSAARHLRKAQVSVLAYAFPDLTNPYFADIGNAIATEAARLNYTVLLDYTFSERDKELNILTGMSPHLIDGLILDSHALDVEDIRQIKSSGPIVLLGERLFGAPFDHVLIDNTAAAYSATRHLIEAGKRKIAAIGVQKARSEAPSLRLQGFMQALTEANLPIDSSLLMDGGLWHRADGASAMQELLKRKREDWPDAIFCFNDLMALGAISVLGAAGYRIPEDIAIIGIDDIEDGRYANPALSTIEPDKQEMARIAVQMLIERIKGQRTQPPESIYVPFRLHARTSTLGRQAASKDYNS
ncbi:LacI family DNA-binding transcriptional regulator [Dictyobacter formicarum]|uniref:LacI family transcriptional regulator n=1 Tax=Dictyobacter formicarum TaxID=2778368 RepID=A0ABQ3VJM1_9CHLR|nr:LacI family DNA-binding transcriptional regulator [Dictyobacter formicarum]GHO86372.1 LacI family transcriptional regulator [Dictyobacter formicarum]